DGEELSLWDVDGRHVVARPRLGATAGANPDAPFPGGRRGVGPFAGGPYIAAIRQGVATILRHGGGPRAFAAATRGFVRDLRTPDRLFRALSATPSGHRLVTIEQVPPAPGQGRGGRGGPGAGADPGTGPGPGAEGGPRAEFIVNLWDP